MCRIVSVHVLWYGYVHTLYTYVLINKNAKNAGDIKSIRGNGV